ncbi:phosphoglycolate phosphatase [Rhodobacterales bacterium HKCCE3408]|nr:phosphoglycolate phosphatase [Rhodobacterales bacterium HKCCE3408]
MARIAFDLDGTLIDSLPDIMEIANALLAEEGRPPLSRPEAMSFVGNGAPAFIERMRAARELPDTGQERLLATYLARYDGAVDLTRPYPHVEDAIDALAAAGHSLGLCTNKPLSPTRAVLAHLNLDRRFPVILAGDSLPERKPDPAPLHATLDRLGTGPRLYVGDSEVDAETAQRAGIPFLLFTGGYRKTPVDRIPHAAAFDDWSALPDLVTRQLASAA